MLDAGLLRRLSPFRKIRRIKPLVDALFVWVKNVMENAYLPKGKTLEGINYYLNHEETLKVFLNDGEVPMDNNVTEGALRTFCLNKHTWKLIDTIACAKSSAIIYSITETTKANNLNSFRYTECLPQELVGLSPRFSKVNFDTLDLFLCIKMTS